MFQRLAGETVVVVVVVKVVVKVVVMESVGQQ